MNFRTPDRRHGPRSGGTDPRPGEDTTRGGQKSHVGDPSGMQPTEPQPNEPKQRRQPGAPPGSPVRGNEPPHAEELDHIERK
jgi:hypothetical protein